MRLHGETGRGVVRGRESAAVEIVNSFTTGAVEVVMVIEVCQFIPGGMTRELNGPKGSICRKGVERTIHGGNTQSWEFTLRQIKDFSGSKRSGGLGNCRKNDASLLGPSFHRIFVVEVL